MPLIRLILLLGVLAAVLVPSSALAAEAGLNVNGGAASGTVENFDQLSDTGAKWARHFLFWDDIDEAGLRGYDRIVAEQDRRGVKTLLTVASASGTPPDAARYAQFVGALAKRNGGRLEAIEIWNEQDESSFWRPGGASPATYVDLLRRSYTAIKAADRSVQVVFGPVVGNNYGYLEEAYAAGAKGFFDVMAAHTDTACLLNGPTSFYRDAGRIARFTFLGYRELRASMLANGDDKPIWLTEIGWSAARHTCEIGTWAGQKLAGVDEASQAKFLLEAFHCLEEDPYVQVAMWFNSRDLGFDGKMNNMYGLLRADGSRRPAYAAFQDYARNGDRLTGRCGDFGAPTVRILSPQAGDVFGPDEPLAIRATASDDDVLRMTFAVKGAPKEIRNFTNGGHPLNLANGVAMTWQGAKRLPFGTHTIVVTAKDRQGNEGSAEVVVRKVDPATLPSQKTTAPKLRLLGKGRTRTLTGQIRSALRSKLAGKVTVEWQNRRNGRWKKIHGAAYNASKPFAFKQKLKYKGQWRVRVRYIGRKPFKSSTTKWLRFKV
jgi:hypothetical protein